MNSDAAKAWIDKLSTEGELDAVFADDGDSRDEEMNEDDAKKYGGIAARLNYFAPDRPW